MNIYDFEIIKLKTVDSTNALAKRMLLEKKISKRTVIISENQTKGRGRQKRIWKSQAGDLFMTLVFPYLKSHAEEISALSLMATIVALEKLFPDLENKFLFKWPNDILLNEKKICGILPEQMLGSESNLIVGIGINIKQNNNYHSINKNEEPKKVMQTIIELFNQIEKNYLKFGFKIAVKNFLSTRIKGIGEAITINKNLNCKLESLNDDFSISVTIDGSKKDINFGEIL